MTDIFRIWIPSHDWTSAVSFFNQTLGFAIAEPTGPDIPTTFGRSTTLQTNNGVLVEVHEQTDPKPKTAVVGLHIGDQPDLRRRLEDEEIVDFTAMNQINSTEHATQFRAPDGNIYRLHTTTPQSQAKISAGGIEWILAPTKHFDRSIQFFQEHLGLTLEQHGKAKNDAWIDRYAMFRAANGMVLEVIEPKVHHHKSFGGPVVSITVQHLMTTMDHFRSIGVAQISDIVTTQSDIGWFYFRIPGGPMAQIQGPHFR